jgi:L-alanine-DL-glutamate epimerase-like enolase superfamily enzyme
LQSFDLTWLEEPIIPDDIAGHARIMAAGGVPIAAGENLRSLWEFKNYIAAGAVSYPEPDVTNCGGVTGFMKVARLAEAFNLPVTSHGAHDITVHLLAACPNRSYLEAHGFGLDRYIEHPLVLDRAWHWRRCGPATASPSTGRDWRISHDRRRRLCHRRSFAPQDLPPHGLQKPDQLQDVPSTCRMSATPALFLLWNSNFDSSICARGAVSFSYGGSDFFYYRLV